MEEVGPVVVRVTWVVGERRLELALLVDGRGWDADRDTPGLSAPGPSSETSSDSSSDLTSPSPPPQQVPDIH